MIATFFAEHYAEISSLAQAWLMAGATRFSLWRQDQLVAAWPNEAASADVGLQAPIVFEQSTFGSLHIEGIANAQAQLRLNADAQLIAGLLRQAEQLHQANQALATSHDQLLGAYEVLRDVHDHANSEQLLLKLASEAARLTGAAGSFTLLVAARSAPLLVTYPSPHLSEKVIWELYWRSQVEPEISHIADGVVITGIPEEVRSLLLVTVAVEPELTLFIGLVNAAYGQFSSRDERMAHVIAQQIGMRIAHKLRSEEQLIQTRLQTEIELARRVQALLMPQRRPAVNGLDIFGRMRPALPVGGDFYDFIESPGRPFLFSVGDVVGKGISAAMLMTMTRGAIHSKAMFMPNPNPALVVRNSNSDLCEDFNQVGTFATALVGQYNSGTREIILANAGHSPVIYRPVHGAARLVRARNTALGVLAGGQFENETVRLSPGDLLVVGSDGLNDTRNAEGTHFGIDRLIELVDQSADQSAEGISEALFRAVDHYAGSRPQDDDQTLVVIKGLER